MTGHFILQLAPYLRRMRIRLIGPSVASKKATAAERQLDDGLIMNPCTNRCRMTEFIIRAPERPRNSRSSVVDTMVPAAEPPVALLGPRDPHRLSGHTRRRLTRSRG